MPRVHASGRVDGALGGPCPAVVDEGPLRGVGGFTRVLRGVLTPRECAAVLAAADALGFERAALYTTADGRDVFAPSRQSMRCVVDSAPFAAALWARVAPFVPATIGGGLRAVGLNERLRILRYERGDGFARHVDGAYTRADGSATSRVTLLLYLNAEYEGGRTTFYRSRHHKDGEEVAPTTGAVALQDQALLHGVPPLERGVKYVLRTEAMYAAE
jgi:prolyl 4-hydroxylase